MTDTVSRAGGIRTEGYWIRWGSIGLIAALLADLMFNINVKKGDNGGTGPMIGVGAILIVLAVVLYVAVFPRFADSAKAALVVGIVSVVLLAAFWSGATLLVAAAAFGYGLRAPTATSARVGMGLAAVAALLDIIAAFASL